MLITKTIPTSKIDEGVRECIKNAKLFLDIANKLNEDHFENQSIMVLALEEFGKAVFLRDKKHLQNIKANQRLTPKIFSMTATKR
jgi:AbiV family abortive infection protein